MTNEEKQQINLFIAEKLFGWKWYKTKFNDRILLNVIYPHLQEHFEFVETDDMNLPINSNQWAELPDACYYENIVNARTKIAERGLQIQFMKALNKIMPNIPIKLTFNAAESYAFEILQSRPEQQAKAIYETLKELET